VKRSHRTPPSKEKDSMNHAFGIALVVALLVPLAAHAEDQKQQVAENKAVESAEAWLSLVDQEKYADGWESAASYLKTAVSKDAFVKSLTAARKPLGNKVSRKLKSKDYRTTLPGAPDGEYVIIQFDTSFENKKMGIETITPMLDKDGAWKVSGYFIK
jgi:hypothetical protein